jgi:hypothetical protein
MHFVDMTMGIKKIQEWTAIPGFRVESPGVMTPEAAEQQLTLDR